MELAQLFDRLVEVVKDVGFPIVAWFVLTSQLEKEREAHEKESLKWAETVNNNTAALERLTQVFEGGNNNGHS